MTCTYNNYLNKDVDIRVHLLTMASVQILDIHFKQVEVKTVLQLKTNNAEMFQPMNTDDNHKLWTVLNE